ncbi:hypothetical protein SPI_02930 [Niveomyces insectorum RCEF 264]|uniref:Uncharacterized protein n=1 Tax=Niveomyces insectorum RCEF 264 TaxID=1081102 RepID=A0A167WX45_9HYPO|nr:hypothetical protein SPI_02930 [Niveomyces insectorum RCEF 264]
MPFGRRPTVVPLKPQWLSSSTGRHISRLAPAKAAQCQSRPFTGASQRNFARASPFRQKGSNEILSAETRRRPQQQQQQKAGPRNASSLFAKLFPDAARERLQRPKISGAPLQESASASLDDSEHWNNDAGINDTDSIPKTDWDAVPEEVRQWLQSETDAETEETKTTAAAAAAEEAAQDTANEPGATSRAKPTVLVLSGTTASLLPSDFFRIAPRIAVAAEAEEHEENEVETNLKSPSRRNSRRSHHHHRRLPVDGWAPGTDGLYKVVQDHDPTTLAPRSRYFLFFGSAAGALAYAQEVRDLHGLARRAVQPPQRRRSRSQAVQAVHEASRSDAARDGSGGTGGGDGPYRGGVGGPTAEEAAALRSFTLLPPTASLDLCTLPDEESSRSIYNNKDDNDHHYHHTTADTTAKVLVVLGDTNTTSGNGRGGGETTIEGVRSLLAADGAVRNLPWAVSDGLNGVVPVPWLVAEQARLQAVAGAAAGQKPPAPARIPSRLPELPRKTGEMDENARYARFVVSFADAVEARRFVRGWHRRRVILPDTSGAADGDGSENGSNGSKTVPPRRAVVDATVLW